jgi:dynein assembly factor 5, axonemal
MVNSTLDDDNKSTRLYVCELLHAILRLYGQSSLMSVDLLHTLYPELIKRLDDQSDEIRMKTLDVFSLYVECLSCNGGPTSPGGGGVYNSVLYQAHTQFIYENLILYLDDENASVRTKVIGKRNREIIEKLEIRSDSICAVRFFFFLIFV